MELIRFALYLRFNPMALAVVASTTTLAVALASIAFDPGRGFQANHTEP
ncbi:MAG: hypothetical protein QJR07_13195 [Acetobacteraceae bacterium]|nr:hypothetical protein [Acetobacteraceae bacterium]